MLDTSRSALRRDADNLQGAYDFRIVRRLADRDLARLVAAREHDPVDMAFIDAEWQRRRRRAGGSNLGGTVAGIALLLSLAGLALGAYGVTRLPAERPPVRAAAPVGAAEEAPRLHYAVDLPPFPQRR